MKIPVELAQIGVEYRKVNRLGIGIVAAGKCERPAGHAVKIRPPSSDNTADSRIDRRRPRIRYGIVRAGLQRKSSVRLVSAVLVEEVIVDSIADRLAGGVTAGAVDVNRDR